MTAKRFKIEWIEEEMYPMPIYHDDDRDKELSYDEVCELLNELHEENNELRLMLNSCSAQRDEFHRGARENTNRVGELKQENEQLKKELLFFYDVANCECSTNWKGNMEKGCKRFFNCTYEEAREKYGDYDGMWWEIND